MNRHLLAYLLLFILITTSASAQRPERFVMSDSVVLWEVGADAYPFPSLIYMTDARGVFVCDYVNSFARVHPAEGIAFSIDQLYSPRQGVKLRIGGVEPKGAVVAVRIRKPRQPYRLYLNGHDTDFPSEGDYICIEREWAAQDEVWIDLLTDE